tara:strand:+ start:70 stop:681 length:612 start_codon:yes stop_codon:yes gene_type:complete
MPKAHPYSATLPIQGAAFDELQGGKVKAGGVMTWFPYFVTAGAAPEVGSPVLVAFFGAILHVACWVVGFIFDILLMMGLDNDEAGDKKFVEYWWFSFVPFCIGFAIVLLNLLYHWGLKAMGGEGISGDVDLTPTAVALIVAGSLISIIFTFLILLDDHSVLSKASEGDFLKDFRACGMISMGCKLYIYTVVQVNQRQIQAAKK